MAATLLAGMRGRQIYEFTATHNAIVVAGSAEAVGVMGWFTGGGHGPLSATYGMGADNVLQVKIVTPTGKFLTANDCQNSDIFWAIRGGGGGTFGVVTEVTMKAYPSPQSTRHNFFMQALNNTTKEQFMDLVAEIWAHLPDLKAGGLQGYINLFPPSIGGLDGWTLL
jgi:FAD/FMN-containing dehydrogenase